MATDAGTEDTLSAATAPLTFHDFLERLRHPAAADLVRPIKNFITDLSKQPPDPARDSASVQDFVSNTEEVFRQHQLFAGSSEEELESAAEGLEKYLMTKLFPRTFAPLPSDAERDRKLSEKIAALQRFVKPKQLDIPDHFQKEASWLLAQKELQKMGSYKAPRDKLVCILNCCRVINNLLLNAAVVAAGGDSDASPPGADEFLPVLIYVLLQANPPQLLSTLDYIQRYRHQSRLVSEASYFFTNLVSAASFLENASHTSLSMSEEDFNSEMKAAQAALLSNSTPELGTSSGSGPPSLQPADSAASESLFNPSSTALPSMPSVPELSNALTQSSIGRTVSSEGEGIGANGRSISADGAAARRRRKPVTEADIVREFPFAFAHVGDLRVKDVELLLADYKELVLKYTALSRRVLDENVGTSESSLAERATHRTSAIPPSAPVSLPTAAPSGSVPPAGLAPGGPPRATESATATAAPGAEALTGPDLPSGKQDSQSTNSAAEGASLVDSSNAAVPNGDATGVGGVTSQTKLSGTGTEGEADQAALPKDSADTALFQGLTVPAS